MKTFYVSSEVYAFIDAASIAEASEQAEAALAEIENVFDFKQDSFLVTDTENLEREMDSVDKIDFIVLLLELAQAELLKGNQIQAGRHLSEAIVKLTRTAPELIAPPEVERIRVEKTYGVA